MKSLLLVRHAKSGWDNPLLQDHDRPLDARGHKDAPMMAKRLLDKGVSIDLFISSTALRALTTAKYFQEAFSAKSEQLIEMQSLYHADVPVFYKTIANIADGCKTAAIFSHNPGITYMANTFGVASVDDMPTCALFAIKANVEHWKDFETAEKQFWFFDYPKL